MLPKIVLVADGDGRELDSTVVVDFNVYSDRPGQVVHHTVDHLVGEEAQSHQHDQYP